MERHDNGPMAPEATSTQKLLKHPLYAHQKKALAFVLKTFEVPIPDSLQEVPNDK